MANQIAENIPIRDNVSVQVSRHIRQFWTPEMCAELRQIAAQNPDFLLEEVLAALDKL